jgi:hypothetical protein
MLSSLTVLFGGVCQIDSDSERFVCDFMVSFGLARDPGAGFRVSTQFMVLKHVGLCEKIGIPTFQMVTCPILRRRVGFGFGGY